jgi:hypothetical protein
MSMSGYCKLFSSIVASTIWRETNETRLLWITMLALADRDGIVEASVPGLADLAKLPIEATRQALQKLQSPDPDSRSPEFEGRRIQAIRGGWKILNYEAYREKCDQNEVLEKHRLRQQRYRERHKLVTLGDARDAALRSVTPAYAYGDASASAGKEGSVREGKPKDIAAVRLYAAEIHLSNTEAEKFFDHFESNGWKQGGRTPMKDWRAALRNWQRNAPNFMRPKINSHEPLENCI